MSIITSPLVRLHELKLWQGNYDNLMQQKRSQNLTSLSDMDSLDGVTPLNNSNLNDEIPSPDRTNWDLKTISPRKPFNELLEEKLAAEDYPSKVSGKPKRPFLRKGSGLARFNLNPNIKKPLLTKPRRSIPKHIEIEPNEEQEETEPTPLKIPEFTIKSKASWSRVTEDENYGTPVSKTPTYYDSENTEEVIKELGLTASFNAPKNLKLDREERNFSNFDHNKSEKELHLFEMLEEKVTHSSFSSANSSIMRLLSSTPNKRRKSPVKNKDLGQNHDFLRKVLENLKYMSQKNAHECTTDSSAKMSNADSTFSEPDDEKWSNSNSRPHTPSSFYTEFETTLERPKRTDAGVNTSFFVEKSESVETQSDQCTGCVQVKNRIEKLEKEMPNIAEEKAKICNYAKQLESNRDELYKEVEEIKKINEKIIEDLREELATEKTKSARDKELFQLYQKDLRPSKKERNEIEILKKELADVKELMKLKETKNGTAQARLRNQIKQLEKEKSELKTLLENVQKENSKLSANQKMHKSTDSKILKEINRNLHRLTEETKLKNKPEMHQNSENVDPHRQQKCRRKSMGDLKERLEKESANQLNKTANPMNEINRNNFKENEDIEVVYNNKYFPSDLEKRYEYADIESENYLKKINESKKDMTVLSEQDLPDGSQEIKYSNGTTKIISSDGKYIYTKYSNDDINQTNLENNIQKYYFKSKDVWFTKYSDGIELVEFPNGQREKKFPDGKVEVLSKDGMQLTRFPGGIQEIKYPDGSKMVISSAEKIIYLPNGQIETHNKEFKKREYPDGTIKILYSEGTQETRYTNGRVRVKNSDGILISDSHMNSS